METPQAEKNVERRTEERVGAGLNVVMRRVSGRCEVGKLVDITTHGYCVVSSLKGQPGEKFRIRIPGLENQLSTLRWSFEGRHGLSLEHPLHPAVLRRLHGDREPLRLAVSDVRGDAASDPSSWAAASDPLAPQREKIMRGEVSLPGLLKRKAPKRDGKLLCGLISRSTNRAAREDRLEERFSPPARDICLRVANAEVEARDMSASGLAIVAELEDLQIGTEVPVEFEGFEEMSGRIVWARSGLVGLSLPADSIDLTVN